MALIDIFVGDPIAYPSERATLARAVQILSAQSIPAVILANVHLGGRQLDLVIGLEHGTLLVESKGLSTAIRGAENGDWEVRLTSGRWKQIPNAYVQTLNEKLALRDAMAAFAGTDVPYPDAALIIVPAIASGSTIRGDFKVSITGLDDLSIRIASVKRHGWPLVQWRAFAAHHRLIAVPSTGAASSIESLDAERLLAAYGEAFTRTYGPPASAMVPVLCMCDGKTVPSTVLLEQAALDSNVLITGDSGCGKSLLTSTIAIAALAHGHVPMVIPARDFEGNLRDVANREAALLYAPSAAVVISAARRLDRRLVVVIDGYNECTPLERRRLTRSIATIIRRYDATVVVSSSIPLEQSELLTMRTYAVPVPDLGVKRAIAQQAAGDGSVDAFSELLGSVRSGLEARLIGLLGQQLSASVSKYGLFDAYVRGRLGPAATDGIRVLSRVAAMMTERISFGLSIRELDRLSDREGVSGALLKTLLDANILDKRGDRVSFSHEMFLNVFAAEAIIRRAGDNSDTVVNALKLPQHLELRLFVLGAIDDDIFRRNVLSKLADVQAVRECLTRQYGRDAQQWANERCEDVLGRISIEIEALRFELSEEFSWSVQAKQETLQTWTAQDRAVLAAIPHELVAGRRLDELLELVGRMDERLASERLRLGDEARTRKVHLLNGLYAASYSGLGVHQMGLAQILSPISCGLLYSGPKVAGSADLQGRIGRNSLSPGQVGLLLALNRYSDHDAPPLGAILPRLLHRLWPEAAHHLRLELMHTAGTSRHALTDDERRALIEAIEALLPSNGGFDSVGIVDALKFLGALDNDEDEHVASVKAEIESVLKDLQSPLMWEAAAGLWNAQFDHPYDGAYCEAWSDLPAEDRKTILFMALRGAGYSSMFTPALIAEVASLADSSAAPVLARWTVLPPKQEFIVGEAMEGFVIAHAALARLHCPLPDRSAEAVSAADQTLLACGEILYWLNRDDLSETERTQSCARSLTILSGYQSGAVAGVVGQFFRSSYMFSENAKRLPGSLPAIMSFDQHFPSEMAAIYRSALQQPAIQFGYFESFRVEHLIDNALGFLGRFSDPGDIPLLRIWSLHPDFGRSAVRAIKMIEQIGN